MKLLRIAAVVPAIVLASLLGTVNSQEQQEGGHQQDSPRELSLVRNRAMTRPTNWQYRNNDIRDTLIVPNADAADASDIPVASRNEGNGMVRQYLRANKTGKAGKSLKSGKAGKGEKIINIIDAPKVIIDPLVPTTSPSKSPTGIPSVSPTENPTDVPSSVPSGAPTISKSPSESPTTPLPSSAPTTPFPSSAPSQTPSQSPTTPLPSSAPTTPLPSSAPSQTPSQSPTTPLPSSAPSASPTRVFKFTDMTPSAEPSDQPTTWLPTTWLPTETPTGRPTTWNPTTWNPTTLADRLTSRAEADALKTLGVNLKHLKRQHKKELAKTADGEAESSSIASNDSGDGGSDSDSHLINQMGLIDEAMGGFGGD